MNRKTSLAYPYHDKISRKWSIKCFINPFCSKLLSHSIPVNCWPSSSKLRSFNFLTFKCISYRVISLCFRILLATCPQSNIYNDHYHRCCRCCAKLWPSPFTCWWIVSGAFSHHLPHRILRQTARYLLFQILVLFCYHYRRYCRLIQQCIRRGEKCG